MTSSCAVVDFGGTAHSAATNFFKAYAFRLQNETFISRVYNILGSFSDLPNRPVKYSLSSSLPVERPALSLVASSLFDNVH